MVVLKLEELRTVVIWTDVETSSLTTGYGLFQTEDGSTESSDAFTFQNFCAIQPRSGTGDLDAVSIFGNASFGKFFCIQATMIDDSPNVVCL